MRWWPWPGRLSDGRDPESSGTRGELWAKLFRHWRFRAAAQARMDGIPRDLVEGIRNAGPGEVVRFGSEAEFKDALLQIELARQEARIEHRRRTESVEEFRRHLERRARINAARDRARG